MYFHELLANTANLSKGEMKRIDSDKKSKRGKVVSKNCLFWHNADE